MRQRMERLRYTPILGIILLGGFSDSAGPPYPASSVITGMSLDWSTHERFALGSDNWQLTWADDDNQYGAWGDGGGFGGSNSDGRVGLGFGRHTQGGFGFFVDMGVAFVGDADVSLEAQGPLAAVPGIQQDLDLEVQDLEDDVGSYLTYWPILSIGVKIPLG